jgi:hypothetical protein
LAELNRAMARVTARNHFPRGHVQGGKQPCGPVSHVIVRVPRAAGLERPQRRPAKTPSPGPFASRPGRSLAATGGRESGRRDSNPRPTEPHSHQGMSKLQQDVAFRRRIERWRPIRICPMLHLR